MRHYLLSILLLWTSSLLANDIKFTASASKTQIGTGEQFEVTFTVNSDIEKFNPPDFKGFQVLAGPNQSSSMTSINGNMSVSMSLSYYLVAVKEGDYTIGSAVIEANGRQFKSNPIKIKVIKGSGSNAPQGGQPSRGNAGDAPVEGNASNISKRLFIRAIPSKSNVYQGEQLSVTYKLYTNIDLIDNALDKLPDFNGFWSQEIKNNNPNVQWETEVYNGTRYNSAVLKQIILFPERSGNLNLDPLGMTFLVRQPVASNDPFDMFFGSYKDAKYKIKSTPVTIRVRPLPDAGKPEGFQGAVGNFSMGALVDKTALKANEAINYTVKISGSGNLKLLKAPVINFPADIEKYDPKLTDHITESINGVSGSREYLYLLIPRHEGTYTIDPLKFSYFNPATGRYATLTAPSFPIKVAKGEVTANVTAFSTAQQDVKMLAKDIRYIKTNKANLYKDGEGFYGSIGYYILLLAGPVAFLLAFGYRKWYRENNKDAVVVKGRNANKIAAKHLANAQKQLLGGDKKAFYEAVYKGLYGYLSDKLNISVADLNKENIQEQLKVRKVDERSIDKMIATLDVCEMARYAPISGTSEQEVFNNAKSIINEIETNASYF